MVLLKAVVISALVTASWCSERRFPEGFRFGAATAAYQVEGAWNVSDKCESIWDRYTHARPEVISDGSNGDVACDSYHQWRRDVEMASELGLDFYRLSISWTRLLPHGFADYISEDGKRYYAQIFDELLLNGIEPVVTIYHWDLPQRLQDLGGWTNPLISTWFANYARVVYSLYADRVKVWLTVNEPLAVCDFVYNTGNIAPGLPDPNIGNYLCNKHVMIAHAKAWRIYDEEYKPKYHGKVSLPNQLVWFEPATNSEDGYEIAELAKEYYTGRYCHPIFSKEGGWPPKIEKIIAENSRKQGYPQSRLPAFTEEEILLVKGTYDFFSLNYYTSRLARKALEGESSPGFFTDIPELGAVLTTHPDWKPGHSSWLFVHPPGIRRQIAWVIKQYGDMEVLVTENGFSTAGGLVDQDRLNYIKDHLEQVLLSIKEDGVNVTGYTVWTLMDNFEWTAGYKTKFGLYEVDFAHPMRARTPRNSAHFYKEVIRHHSLDLPYFKDEL